jgi:hypothetical protein
LYLPAAGLAVEPQVRTAGGTGVEVGR